jgi:hypothetical protein
MYFKFSMFGQTVELDSIKEVLRITKNSKIKEKQLTEKLQLDFYDMFSNTGIPVVLPKLIKDFGPIEEGNVWTLEYNSLYLSGAEIENSVFKPYLQELIEGLDKIFNTTFVDPKRVDKLEITYHNEDVSDIHPSILEMGDCSHSEIITLDRKSALLTYAKRYPQQCFHNKFECHCENQIITILDDLPKYLQYFESRDFDGDSALVTFTITHHDKSTESFVRNFNYDTGNLTMNSFLRAIREVLKQTIINDGLLDLN